MSQTRIQGECPHCRGELPLGACLVDRRVKHLENEAQNTLTEPSRNESQLRDFSEYCRENPELRFWQALAAWSGYHKILVSDVGCKPVDTFYWEGKDGLSHQENR